MLTTLQKVVILGLAMVIAFGTAWRVQALRYTGQLEYQAKLQADDLNNLTQVALRQQQIEQGKRLASEQTLAKSDQQHFKELSDVQRTQNLLRDRLATSDLRLSVLLSEDSASGCRVSPTSSAVGVVHGTHRAQLDPAYAQRIIGITDAGDQGLIALRACQAYAKEVSVSR